jgi:hypothetical protein
VFGGDIATIYMIFARIIIFLREVGKNKMKKRLLRYGSMIGAVCACVIIPVDSAKADGVFFADNLSVVSPFEQQSAPVVDSVYASAPVSAVSVSSLDQINVVPVAYEEAVTPISYLEQEASKNKNVREISSAADGVVQGLVAVDDGTSVGGYLPNMSRPEVSIDGEYQTASAIKREKPEMLIDLDAASSVQIVGNEGVKIKDENLAALNVSAAAPPVIKLDEDAGRAAAKAHARHEKKPAYEYEKDMYVIKLPDEKPDLSGKEFIQVKPEDAWAPSRVIPAKKPEKLAADSASEKALNIPDASDIGTVPVATNDIISSPKINVVPMELKLNFKRGQTIISQKTLELLRNMAAEVNKTAIVAVEINASVGNLPQKKRAALISGIFKEEGVDSKKIHINYNNVEHDNSVVVKMLGKNTRRREIKVSKWANKISEVSYIHGPYYVVEK